LDCVIQENRGGASQVSEIKRTESECLNEFMRLIMDGKSRLVFRTIFLMSGESSDVLLNQLKLTRKQFYSRITRLMKARLIRRYKGRYFLTSYGTVIYDIHRLLESTITNHQIKKILISGS
jgi:predicted transcriptional regulator